MAKPIQILPSLIAERIAAGEVVERPASVVKELVENSIDAGATAVEVKLSRGGTDLIEVTDNGSGMTREDIEICVCRHATSKITVFEDLSKLGTLGFRGEALPSIASVSDLTVTSREKTASETFEIRASQTAPVRAKAQTVANLNFLGDQHGTRVRVASLFSQVPARLKFLKSLGAEASAVREIIERLAITHPEVQFKLTSDDRVLLNLPSESLKKRTIRMLAGDNPYEALETTLPGAYGIEIIWLKGLSFPHTRSMYQIVNQRALRDRTLQMALLNPLKQSFLPGNFPAIVAKLDVPADEIDVNVHPTKTEIRFLESGKIFALCDAAIKRLLETAKESPAFQGSPFAGQSYRSNFSQEQASALNLAGGFQTPGYTPFLNAGAASLLPSFEQNRASENADVPFSTQGAQPGNHASQPAYLNSSFIDSTPFGEYRGVLFSTYFVFEMGEELMLVDQHAAHERIRYEKLKNKILKHEKIETQALLVPEVVKFAPDRIADLREKLSSLDTLGFEVEIFGEDSVLFRGVPAVWGNSSLSTRLKNLCERLIETDFQPQNLTWDETLFEKIAMEACRSSFKGGDYIHEAGAVDLTQKLFQCEHPGNCPHGRPTTIKISKSKVEEWFSRLS
ncbi:MAG: DNA mismatch repair endonuclease MutL [Bdellovibrionales bacterium]|nr:DNA mismatch repair endonuclease MutL [Oligoflexia bacterium]